MRGAGARGGGGGGGGGNPVVSEETYTTVAQDADGNPVMRVITVRKRKDGSSERIVKNQPL